MRKRPVGNLRWAGEGAGLARVRRIIVGRSLMNFDAVLLQHTVVLRLTVHTVTAKALKKE